MFDLFVNMLKINRVEIICIKFLVGIKLNNLMN